MAKLRFAWRRAVRQEQLGTTLGFAWSATEHSCAKCLRVFYSAEANIFDDLGLNPTQLTFVAQNFNAGQMPTTAQLISSGFPATIPPGDSVNILGAVETTGPRRTIPIIMEWNLNVQHPVRSELGRSNRLRRYSAYHLWNHEAIDLNQATQILDTNFCGPAAERLPFSGFGRRYFNQQPNMTAVLPLDFPQLQMFYNAFQASLNKRFANGFNFLAAYTFARTWAMPMAT
jgi:hypothetical protein